MSNLHADPAASKRLTIREEDYAVARAAGMGQSEAYFRAGYKWTGKPGVEQVEANKVERRPHVAARLKELRDAYASKIVEASRGAPPTDPAPSYDVNDAMLELDEAAMIAKERGNPAALAKVVEIRMKLYGLGVSDAKNPKDKDEVPPERLEEMLATLQTMKEQRAKPGTTH